MIKNKRKVIKNNKIVWFGLGIGAVLIFQKIMTLLSLLIQSGRLKSDYLLVGLLVSALMFSSYQVLLNTQKNNRLEIDESETPPKWENIK